MLEINIKRYFKITHIFSSAAFQVVLVVKNLPASAGDVRVVGSIPRSRRSPGGGHGNPFQYSCLENSHRQRSMASYNPQGHKEPDTTEGTEHACIYQERSSST